MKPIIYMATDHAGVALKNALRDFVHYELGYTVVDCGATQEDVNDDYPDYIGKAAREVSLHPTNRAIIFGGSGQGEAMVANRFPNVRATVYYGGSSDIITLSREHNDANVLSLGARFVSEDDAKAVVSQWLAVAFSGDERHIRRIKKIEHVLD